MRFLLRLLMTLVGIVAFIGMLAFGGLYAYGQWGAPLVNDQITAVEAKIEKDLEEEHPGAEITIDIEEVFYKFEGVNPHVVFEVSALAEFEGNILEDTTQYIKFNVMSIVSGGDEFENLSEAAWADTKAGFKNAPEMIFKAELAKTTGMTYGIIAGAVFVGSILVKVIFLRKKKI